MTNLPDTIPVNVANTSPSWWQWINVTVAILLFLLSLAGLTELVYAFFDDPAGRTDFLDFAAFYVAGAVLNSEQPILYDADVTAQVIESINFTTRYTPYIYPPFFAVLFRPLAQLPYATVRVVWTICNLVCLALSTHLMLRLLKWPFNSLSYAVVTLIALSFPPVALNILVYGQVNVLLLWLLLVTYSYSRNGNTLPQHVVAGFALGIAAGLKVFPAVLIPYFWLRNSRGVAYAAVAILSLTFLVGIAGAGWANTLSFLQQLPHLHVQGQAILFWLNDSVSATIQRLFVPYSFAFHSYLMKEPVTFTIAPLLHRQSLGVRLGQIANLVVFGVSMVTLLVTWLAYRKENLTDPDLAQGFLVATSLLLLPLSWASTHSLLLLPITLLLMQIKLVSSRHQLWFSLLLLAWAFILGHRLWPWLGFWTNHPPLWTTTLGMLGALFIWLLLLVKLWQQSWSRLNLFAMGLSDWHQSTPS